MKILQTPVRFPPYIGGVESYTHDMSKELVELGHDVTVLCAKAKEESAYREVIDGVEVERLDDIGKVAQTNIMPQFPISVLQHAREADIIHTHIPTPWTADFSALAAKLTGTPLVVTYHNDIVGNDLLDYVASVYNHTALRFTLATADKILITQPDYLESSDHLHRYAEKVEVNSNGVDVEKFRPIDVKDEDVERLGFSNESPNLFFLSVLDDVHEYKGLDVLLEAMSLLVERDGTTPRLVVGGGGELKPEYESLASELGVSEYVHFTGYIPDDDLVTAYNIADLFVLPSLSSDQEGFGLVVLEALACGTPVVTTEVVGVSDQITSYDLGSLAQVGDVESLSQTIEFELENSCSNDPDQMREFCESRYSWSSSAEELSSIYLDMFDRAH
ncbi:glycosyltransferase [Haloferax volcanii DSM 14919]|uniref:Glycosyltransferase n=1 Tax=Haloferax lucentense (strain DSM 14919 / JCM 9276 / NCIMB 13854 / Aa 2.2) TaxID=1230452 RepID=M0GUX9_HALL2|nr:glycosyltransferase family 4 protein [Haloferax lucentense]ELZ75342.1 glycosyltransferase [Haloferax lucentense DSM 14919]